MSPQDRQLAEYLRARRESLQPEDVGLSRGPGRRVPGLRREEVADRAGISVDYYLRLEQGRDRQPSEQVVRALSRALLLDPDASDYLHRISGPTPAARRAASPETLHGVMRLLTSWSHNPAYVIDSNLDVVAANDAARALAPGYFEPGANLLVSAFDASVDPHSRNEWEKTVRRLASALRYHADPADPRLQQILGDLSVRSRPFRRIWALHEAQRHPSGVGSYEIPPVGWVPLQWQILDIPGTPGHLLTTFFAEPGSVAERALQGLTRSSRPDDAAATSAAL